MEIASIKNFFCEIRLNVTDKILYIFSHFLCANIVFNYFFFILFILVVPWLMSFVGSCHSVRKLRRKRTRKNFLRLKKKRGEKG